METSTSIDPGRYSPTIACNIYLGVAEVVARTDAVWLSVAPLGYLADGRQLMPLPVSAELTLPEVGIMLGRLPGRELPPSAGHVIGVLRDVLERS